MASPMMLTPPPGGDVSRGDTVLGIDWTYVAIDIVVVAARFFVRIKTRTLGWEDWCMFVALLFMIGTHGIITEIVYLGLGRHEFYVLTETPGNVVPLLRNIWALQFVSFYTLAFAKLSIAGLVVRLISPTNPWTIRFIWSSTILFCVITVITTILALAGCQPIQANWNPTTPGAHCLPTGFTNGWPKFLGAYSAFMDFALALIPIYFVWNLQLAPKKKIGLSFILGLGILAGVAACLKTALQASPTDFTWGAVSLYLWSSTEFFLNIFCGCIPTLKPLYDYFAHGKAIMPQESRRSHGEKGGALQGIRMFGSSLLSVVRSDRLRLRGSGHSTDKSGSIRSGTEKDHRHTDTVKSDEHEIQVNTSIDIESAPDDGTSPPQRAQFGEQVEYPFTGRRSYV